MTTHLEPVHPGEILREEFLAPLGLSATALARAIRVPPNRVTRLLNAQAAVTPDTALRLAQAFRTSPQFWLALQQRFDLDSALDRGESYADITPLVPAMEP